MNMCVAVRDITGHKHIKSTTVSWQLHNDTEHTVIYATCNFCVCIISQLSQTIEPLLPVGPTYQGVIEMCDLGQHASETAKSSAPYIRYNYNKIQRVRSSFGC